MTFIPTSIELLQAIKANNATKAEEVILYSDTRRDLIIEHTTEHGRDSLVNLLPKFKSQGLVFNIKTLLNI